jgi:arylsulfatase A-like enzyme
MTLMTGLYPTSHGVTLKAKVLLPKIPTLGQVLREKGYRLYANTCGAFVHGGHGFDRGFEIYDNQMKPLDDTLSQAQTWIEGLKPGEGYFAFLHTFDVHCPYDPPSKYRLMFHTRPMEDQLETRGKCGDTHYNKMSLSSGQVGFLSDMYDADIRAADEALGTFFRFLETRGAFKNTVVILLSDHGEEFKEHGRIGHERTLYIESLMVPLIIAAPGLKPRVVQDGVGLADVMPTVLEMLGIESPPVEGRSLLPLMVGSGRSWREQPLFSELDRHIRLRSIAHDQYHLIINTTKGKRELYNLKTDPTEQSNLIHGLPDKAEDLEEMLGVHFDNLSKPQKSLDRTLSTEQIEKLRSLGYVD